MESEGWRVVRFIVADVLESPEGIWQAVKELIDDGASPPLLALYLTEAVRG